MSGVESREWIQDRVSDLTASCSDIKDIRPDTVNTFDSWSALKLILLSTTVFMYTTVISSYRDRFYYIDALSGSGVSEYGKSDECFLGSPILAAKAAVEPFEKMYFIEQDEEKADALKKRLDYAFYESDMDFKPPISFEVIQGDSNKQISEVVSDIWRNEHLKAQNPNFHHLTFIDNQGLDFKMSSLEEISPTPTGDLLVNFPTSNVRRATGHNPSADALTDFYGDDVWRKASKKQDLLDFYIQKLMKLDKEKQVIANVESGVKNFEYDLIYATRRTSSNSEYIKAVKHAKEFIENVDGADVKDMLDILKGDQSTMEEFMPERNVEGQSNIGDFYE